MKENYDNCTQKYCCEDQNPYTGQFTKPAGCANVNCIPAQYGRGDLPNICYVGNEDEDPCNLMDSGDYVCPSTCVSECCPGNLNKPQPQPQQSQLYYLDSCNGDMPNCKPCNSPDECSSKTNNHQYYNSYNDCYSYGECNP
jgi:hypothetical protein